MLLRCLYAEHIKLRHSPVWLAFLLMPVLPAIMGTFNYLQNQAVLENGWYSLWSQHTLFECYFFLPAIIAVYASYLWRLEHTGTNWNQTLTAPLPVSLIFITKFAMTAIMVIFTQFWIGLLFIIAGLLAGIQDSLPPQLIGWLFYGALGAVVVCALQLSISLVIRNFAAPVAVAVAGGVGGLMMMAKGWGLWFPYSLISLGMNANNPQGDSMVSAEQFIFHCVFYLFIFCLFCIVWMKKRDIAAE